MRQLSFRVWTEPAIAGKLHYPQSMNQGQQLTCLIDGLNVRNVVVSCLSAFGILIGRSRHSKELTGIRELRPFSGIGNTCPFPCGANINYPRILTTTFRRLWARDLPNNTG